uniref:Putative secreted protein n=1 Tax=Rhipicephalus microplus TaxID=6941 RepID=A0A6M2DDA6_RHIMP
MAAKQVVGATRCSALSALLFRHWLRGCTCSPCQLLVPACFLIHQTQCAQTQAIKMKHVQPVCVWIRKQMWHNYFILKCSKLEIE